ncbi:putative T6SS immunity periplasmic lipoprotein [Brenneria tiliae]|uniref:putative T6SS immunity periplasmic lipoprotein n=1 Tax=Brenneria tiliae TaxID=2914984 RepID=UPI002014957C|nr:putative T6SS immunity periplasmic lipoprotein [Brenneria tiliae]MCL2898448.1 hypothetical protein [Brenneria tiliae]MCL2903010.1 hypothetical protein [Brenneria tiliae]
MKIFSLLLVVFFMVGCESNDPRPKTYRATITTVNDKVCVLAPAESGEYLNGLEFNEAGSEQKRFRKHFSIADKEPVLLSPDSAFPIMGTNLKLDMITEFL